MSEIDQATLVAEAHRIADDVLFVHALDADVAAGVPERQLQCMADAGFYAISTHCDPSTVAQIIEIFAGGCLTTTFVWTQHLGATAAAYDHESSQLRELGQELASGRQRGGVAFAHMLRPGAPLTTVEQDEAGWRLSGSAPWVTGWGHIDLVHVAARHGDEIVWMLIDAKPSASLHSEPIDFVVVDATQTEVLHFADHPVPVERVTKVENYEQWRANYALGLRTNGSLALGVASRCCRLLSGSLLDAELAQVRTRLNAVAPTDVEAMSRARAAASLFAIKAATALTAETGGRAVMMNNHAQRLMREAMFVLVQGQTPTIKAEMLSQLAG